MARPKKADTPKQSQQPDAILIDESIGWMEHGVLRQFHEGQHVTNPSDIAALIAHGAKYMEVLS